MHICAALNELAILQMLVEHGADIEKQGRFATIGTPLHVACSSGNAHAANLLISLGADRNCREPTGHTPMHFACRSGNYEVAFMLIDLEVDLALRADNNKVAFDYVVVATIKEKMQLAAAVVDARIQARLAAERAAAKAEADRLRREQERLERLRREEEERIRLAVLRTAAFTKALRSVADISGELGALLGVAEEYPDQDINVNIIQPATEFVLDEGFRFAADNEYDMDSLTNTVHSHTTVGTTYAVYQLINSLSDSSALTRASLRGFHEVVHALLQWPGININYQDSNGNTALHNAALIGNRDIVEMLLTAGIKLTTMNHAGKVAANLAKTNFLRELIRNPALLAHQRKYQEGVLDHVFVQKKCRDGLSLSMDEANKVNSFLEYDHNITPEKPGHSPTDGDHSKHAQSSALALTVTGRPEDSPTRSKSKYYKSPSKKGASHPSAVAHPSAAGHVHVHSILKHPEDEISAPPLLVFTPETVPPELSHLFPHAAMNIPAYAMPGVLALPAAQASPNLPGAPQQSGASTAQPQPMAAVTDKYGPVPGAFGGSHADFFFRTPHATQRRHPQEPEFEGRHDGRSGPPLFLDLLTLQQGYLPTAFDTTEEWNEVKDLLWLLGYPHKPQSSTESALQQDSLAVYSGYTQTPDVDKRYYLHRLAVVMNKLQDAFTDSDERQLKLTAAANNDSSESFDIDQETLGIVSGKLPAIPSAVTSPLKGKRNKPASFTAPPMASPVAEIKHALSLETHNRTDIEVAEENKRELQAELSIDWARIPANICRQDVHRLVRFSKLCEEFVILALQLYEPRDYGWPNALTTGEGGYISQALRDNVAYMRYYGFVTTEVEELLLNLVDLGFTACFQDPPTQLEDHTQCKKVGFAEDSHQPETTWKAKTYPKPVRRVPNLFLNPPRYWRLAVDSVYETSEFIKTKAEQGYPLDAVRAHLWAHTGRVVIQQQRERAKQKYFGVHNTPPISIGGSSKVLSSSAVTASSRRLAIKDASQQAVGTSAANAVVQGGYRRWLADLLLSDYEAYFQNQGFRCLGDFEGLTEQDCIQYFPFLKVCTVSDSFFVFQTTPQFTISYFIILGGRFEKIDQSCAPAYRRNNRPISNS